MLGKKIVLFICGICLFVQNNAVSQEVGLVLSGGGAKGLAHLGVIKAFEENEIPIDYLTGTSMGAIVGSMYAAGYSPEQMEEIFYSEDFQNWMRGKALEVYDFF
jgi:NTE family protein